jgi:hypothetical protein
VKLIDNPAVVEDYPTFVERKISPKVKQRGKLGMLLYFAAKAVEEAVEFQSILTKYEYHGLEYDERDLQYENGDMRFYNQAICYALGKPAQMIEAMNMEKLTARGDYADHIARLNEQHREAQEAVSTLTDLGWEWEGDKWVDRRDVNFSDEIYLAQDDS